MVPWGPRQPAVSLPRLRAGCAAWFRFLGVFLCSSVSLWWSHLSPLKMEEGPSVGLFKTPAPLPRPGAFRRAAPHGSRGRSQARNPLPVLAPWVPSLVMVFFLHMLVGCPTDGVITIPRMVSGVCVLGLLGFGPHPLSVKVTPFRFPQGLPFFSWFPTSVLHTDLPGSRG
jgi:hypothetical protein